MNLYNNLKHSLQFSTSYSTRVGYIMTDGKFLDLEQNFNVLYPDIDNATLKVSHRDLDVYAVANNLVEDYTDKILIDSDNAVCINDGSIYGQEIPYFILPEEPLTDEQYNSLKRWIEHVQLSGDNYIHLMSKKRFIYRRYEFSKSDDDGLWTPNEIIKDIKHFYVGGHFTYE